MKLIYNVEKTCPIIIKVKHEENTSRVCGFKINQLNTR